ncbi:MAG: hypothetical protein AMK75_05475 [Planctomycetes bacterium SM23_65]|nr:MAG: hypothetical protein AMK75_05475 [Planctomycetes bacterium SM23_65]
MFRKLAWFSVVLIGVVCVTAVLVRAAGAETVTVNVVQVLASNEGGDYVDPALGALGRRLKKTYPYRNYKKVGSSSQSSGVGGQLQFSLHGGMLLTLQVKSFKASVVSMLAVVTRGRKSLLTTNLTVASGRTVIIGVPVGTNRLILAITPYVK